MSVVFWFPFLMVNNLSRFKVNNFSNTTGYCKTVKDLHYNANNNKNSLAFGNAMAIDTQFL